MKDEIVTAILQEMTPVLDQEQLTRLKSVVRVQLCGYDISKKETGLMCADQNGQNYLRVFLDAFRQNGKSEGTIEQYQLHLSRMLSYVGKNVEDIEDDDLIEYMEKYKSIRKVSNRYMNNIRLVFNSFFRWLQRKKVLCEILWMAGTNQVQAGCKKAIVSGGVEKVRCACEQERDLAIVEFLYSVPCAFQELCRLNRDDICWESVMSGAGEGNKDGKCT